MKHVIASVMLCALALSFSACGNDETVVVEQQPTVIRQAPPVLGVPAGISIKDVEQTCVNGYDNRTRRCF